MTHKILWYWQKHRQTENEPNRGNKDPQVYGKLITDKN